MLERLMAGLTIAYYETDWRAVGFIALWLLGMGLVGGIETGSIPLPF